MQEVILLSLWSACGVMVTVIGNWIGDSSSNSGQGCLC